MFLAGIILNKGLKAISFNYIILLLMALVFLMVNTAHIDIRRMMPVFPIIYLAYAQILEVNKSKKWVKTNKKIVIAGYLALTLLGIFVL